jgi:hypothetical protein
MYLGESEEMISLATRSFPLWLVHVVDGRDLGLKFEWMRYGVRIRLARKNYALPVTCGLRAPV